MTTAVDYSVPAVIDVAYVEKVMAALDHVYGDAIRTLAHDRQITQEFLEHLAAIYTPKEFAFTQDVWVRDVASGLQALLPTPGDPATHVAQVVTATASCVVAAVSRDFSATRASPDKPTPQWFIALVSKPINPPRSLNPTPWLISFDGFVSGDREPITPCT